jgi:hypothetical protein
MMGPWAVYSIVEAELGPADRMVTPRRLYPAPITRIGLMDLAAREIAAQLNENWGYSARRAGYRGIDRLERVYPKG